MTIRAGRYLFIKIETDQGISGIGEGGAWGFIDGMSGVLENMKKYLIGRDPMQTELHWNTLYRSLYFRGSMVMSAISAIDIALWDIKGKALGVPVYQLLGGQCRDRVRSYAPVFESEPEKMAEACVRLREKGFTAARLMMTYMDIPADKRLPAETFSGLTSGRAACVKACREAVGDNFDFCLEVHRSMTPPQAIAFAGAVEQYHPLFIEDPIAPDNMDAMADAASHINIPVATGERAVHINEIEMLLSRNAAKYIRPDLCVVGGITAGKKIAAIAESHYAGIVPHNPLGPVSTAACLQLDACIPNFTIQEYPSFNMDGGENSMIKKPLEVLDGYLLVPDAPGIGIELADYIEEKYPPVQRELPSPVSYDGFIQDR